MLDLNRKVNYLVIEVDDRKCSSALRPTESSLLATMI